jgi:uncharacterized protein YjiK
MPKPIAGRAETVSERPLGIDEASAVAAVADGTFYVVGDEDGLFRCRPGSAPTPIATGDAFIDLEGVCVTADGAALYALAERAGKVWRAPIDKLGSFECLGSLPELSDHGNNGWEGVAHGNFGGAEVLVAVHQAKPRRVGLFDPATLAPRAVLRLPKAARKVLGDLNDVTIAGDKLLVLSGGTGYIAELALVEGELALVQLYSLATSKRDVPEGIDLADDGRLWVVTDGRGMLREVRLVPGQ